MDQVQTLFWIRLWTRVCAHGSLPIIGLKLRNAILDLPTLASEGPVVVVSTSNISFGRERFKNASPPLPIFFVGSTSPRNSQRINLPKLSPDHHSEGSPPLMDASIISTSSGEPATDSGNIPDEPIISLPHALSGSQILQISQDMIHQTPQNSLPDIATPRRMFKEPRSRNSKQIPFRKSSGHVAHLGKHVEQQKKVLLKVRIPSLADVNVSKKIGSASKFRGATVSEILDLDPSQPASPEPVAVSISAVSQEAVQDATPISKYVPNEAQFHFNDSLQVQAEDLPSTSHPEQSQLVRDDPSIPITYDKVWDPFAPPPQLQEVPTEMATLQPYPSPAITTRSMSFSLPSNYTEPTIHHAPPVLPSISVAPNENPPLPAWKIASQSIVKAPKGPELARLEDCLSEDIAIRAVTDGWDSIGEPWELPPFWRVIRVLDELIFGKFNPVVRLASLRVVHLLMRYHSDPSLERAKNMPKFYNLK
jgi:hypothetical protein